MIGFTLESEISGGIMNRREFLKMSALAVSAPAFGKSAPQNMADGIEEASLFKIRPHVQLLNEDAVAIVWVTHSKSTGYVTWSQDGWKTTERAWDEEDGLLSANSTLHRAFISGIDPLKPLEYKAHSRPFKNFGPYSVSYSGVEEVCSGTMRAIAPVDAEVSWAMFNDVHENLAVYNKFMPYLSDISGFCVLNGDIVNHVDDEKDVTDRLIEPLSRIAQKTSLPVWYLRGNHETRGAFARNMRDYLALKDGHYFGAASLGGIRFVFLDCGEDKKDTNFAYSGLVNFDRYIERQNAWLEKEVASSEWKSAKARIAIRHIPAALTIPHHNGWKHGLGRLNHMDDILKNANVTLAMGAHLHNWGFHAPIPDRPYPLVVGGGPKLGEPIGKSSATLVKCHCKGGAIAVRILDETGKVVSSENVKI